MRRIILPVVLLAATCASHAAQAQFARGGYLMAGPGAGGSGLADARFGVDMAYTMEAGGRNGPYVGGRGTLGIHWLRADQAAFRDVYGGEAKGGDGTLYDTGADVEVGFGAGVLRVYGFTGIHYYQQFQDPATVRAGSEEIEVTSRRRETIANAHGAGVQLWLADTGGLVAEWYRGGGQDGVMRLSGTRFGLRWAW